MIMTTKTKDNNILLSAQPFQKKLQKKIKTIKIITTKTKPNNLLLSAIKCTTLPKKITELEGKKTWLNKYDHKKHNNN